MKVCNYIVIMTGMIIILYLGGIDIGLNQLIDLIKLVVGEGGIESVDITNSMIFQAVFASWGVLGGIALGIGGGIIASIAGVRSQLENLILLPIITGTLGGFLQSFSSLMRYMITTGQQWAIAAIVIIFIPFSVGFIIALAEFFRGTD